MLIESTGMLNFYTCNGAHTLFTGQRERERERERDRDRDRERERERERIRNALAPIKKGALGYNIVPFYGCLRFSSPSRSLSLLPLPSSFSSL
jgi:hypothetical protein